MNSTIVTTDGKAQTTGKFMRYMVDKYHRDMLPYIYYPLPEVYNAIKNIPYRPDPKDRETLMRPLYTMTLDGTGGDCDDKAIALASYCQLCGLPWRFEAVRKYNAPTWHHVINGIKLAGKWIIADATYSDNTFGQYREQYADHLLL